MKLCLLFLVISISAAIANNGYAQNTRLSIHLQDGTLKELIGSIENQSEFIFVFYDGIVDLDKRIEIDSDNQTIEEILDEAFKSTEISYRIYGRQVAIGKRDPVTGEFEKEIPIVADKKLSGVVTDAKGDPIQGATIIVKGTTIGTITDLNGKFAIAVPEDAKILSFSFIGFTTQEIAIGSQTDFKIILQEAVFGFEEVVVVGYGTQKKISVTGSISSVGNKELNQAPVSNISNALVGHVVGLSSTQSSGEPGFDAANISIRGVGTLNSSGQSPLVIIDGVQSSFEIMNAIDPHEIENVSVLKDASATAVYGVRGANGVIVLTTKRGISGKPQISFSSSFGLTQLTTRLKMVDSYNYALFRNEAIKLDKDPSFNSFLFSDEELWKFKNNRDYTAAEVDAMAITPEQKTALMAQPALYYTSHDYFEEQYGGSSPQQQYNLNLSGGGEKVLYFTSIGYFQQNGVFKNANYGGADINSYYKRYNFRSNYDINVIKNLKITTDLSGQFATNGGILGGSQDGDITGAYARHKAMMVAILDGTPFHGPGIVDGKLVTGFVSSNNPLGSKGGGGFSPIANILTRPFLTSFNTNLNANIKLRYALDFLTKGLSLSGSFSYNDTYLKSVYRYRPVPQYTVTRNPANPAEILFIGGNVGPASVSDNFTNSKLRRQYYEVAANYVRDFGKHSVTGLVLWNAQKTFSPYLLYNVPSGLLGVAARATYSYDRRYLAEVNFGYNGSENFPEGNRFGFFPAFSAGWIVSEESFFPEGWISWLKLRGSYGEVGNDQIGGGRFLYLPSTWGYGSNTYYGGYSFGNTDGSSLDPFYAGAFEDKVGNPFVTWERAKKSNIGLEINFFNNRLSFTGDIFQEKRDNILWTLGTVPAIVAASLPSANIGKVSNHGYEVQSGWVDKIGKVEYSLKASVSYAKNLIEFMDEPAYPYAWMNETGFSLDQFKGLKSDGFYNTDEEASNRPYSGVDGNKVTPGDIRYVDINGDGTIDSEDNVPVGFSNLPRYAFNSNLGLAYKGFAISALFIGTANGSFPLESFYITNPFYMSEGAALAFQYDGRWTPEKVEKGITPTFPRASMRTFSSQNGQFSDFWLKSTDFVRLKNVEVSYTFSKIGALYRAGVNGLRVYFNGNNLYTWTKLMDGIDPEQQNSGGASLGYLYPMIRIYSFGVNIQF